MSILLKKEIIQNFEDGRIIMNPYISSQVGPNSYDVRLGDTLKVYKKRTLDVKKKNKTKTIKIPEKGLVLKPRKLYLGYTIEKVGSDYFIPMYEGRSSKARLGIQSHISAGFGDVGFKQQWTLEILVPHRIRVYPGMKIGQVYFMSINQEANLVENRYSGKYVSQNGAQASKSYLDW